MACICFLLLISPNTIAETYSLATAKSGALITFQTTTVSGKIVDETGVGMPGVNVIISGTTTGTTSDSEGQYTIGIPSDNTNPTLVFSFIGYATQELQVNGQSLINLVMKIDVQALNEVVVVGYGTQKRSDVTGSIVSVSEQSLRDVPVANLIEGLQGRAAGIDIQKGGGNSKPGAAPVIRIRGVRSLTAGNDPLFVVDGIPYNGSINDLNPDDISSVEVLKDASSTAIYGSRGANGVILVSTKRGKPGSAPLITYSGYTGFVKHLGKFDIMNGQQFAELKKWAKIWGTSPANYTGLDDPKFLTDGTFTPEEVESLELGRSVDWQDLIYKTGVMTDHQVGVSGGSEKSQYAMSIGYFNETGIYPGQGFERYTAKLSVDQQIGNRIKIGLNSLNTFSKRTGEGINPMGQVLRANPLVTPYDANGQLWGFIPGNASQVWNPLADFVEGAVAEDRNRVGTFTTMFLEAKIMDGLKYRFNGGVELKSDTYGNFYGQKTTYTLGVRNRTSNRSRFDTDYTLENLITYDKTFAGKHKVNFTGLFSLQESLMRSTSYNNSEILADYIQYFNPEFSGPEVTGSGEYEQWAILSYMGRINYGFNDKYMVTLTMRTDGSSRLAPGNKWRTFPSAAVAWNVSEELFLAGTPAFTNLKVRASYGRVGNAAIDPYSVQGRLTRINYNFGNTLTTGLYPSHAPNPDLEWEYTSSANVGIDFGLLQNRITGTFEAYHQFTDKLLLEQQLPLSQGIPNRILRNVGKTENKGIELQLSSVNIDGDGRNKFRWTTDINFFINRGQITQLASGVTKDLGNAWFVGEPIGVIFDYEKIGIWQNTPADSALAKSMQLTVTGNNGAYTPSSVIGTIKVADLAGVDADGNVTGPDGRITADDRTIIGTSQPKWQGGITSRFAFKGFDLTVVAFGRFGGTLVSSMHNSGFANTFQGNYNNLVVDFWTPSNGQNYYPKPNQASTNPLYSSTRGYFDGSYMKIRSVSLGYNFAPSLLEKIHLKSARLYATVNDAFILFSEYRNKYNGVDPEAINGDNNRQQINVDTPATYSVVFGLNITL
ncbi:MAG: SusC/RagA family TonB-linked outer membrane protein [Bacteroidota bacterium]